MDKKTCKFTPDFEKSVELFFEAVHTMIKSTENLECIEHQLFQTVEDLEVNYISTIKKEEYIVEVAKERIKTVVMNNSHGPNRYFHFHGLFFILFEHWIIPFDFCTTPQES